MSDPINALPPTHAEVEADRLANKIIVDPQFTRFVQVSPEMVEQLKSAASIPVTVRIEEHGQELRLIAIPFDTTEAAIHRARLSRIDDHVGEVCENSTKELPCGPVEYSDSDGVPLCAECYQSLLDDHNALPDCPKCNGTGDGDGLESGDECPDCDGTGKRVPEPDEPAPFLEHVKEWQASETRDPDNRAWRIVLDALEEGVKLARREKDAPDQDIGLSAIASRCVDRLATVGSVKTLSEILDMLRWQDFRQRAVVTIDISENAEYETVLLSVALSKSVALLDGSTFADRNALLSGKGIDSGERIDALWDAARTAKESKGSEGDNV